MNSGLRCHQSRRKNIEKRFHVIRYMCKVNRDKKIITKTTKEADTQFVYIHDKKW